MLPSFLIPEQTLIAKITKLIEAFQKTGGFSSKKAILDALKNTKKTLLEIQETYKNIYTKDQLDEIGLLYNTLIKKSNELLRLQTEALSSINFLTEGITPGATEEETLARFFEHYRIHEEEALTSDSENDDETAQETTPVIIEDLEEDHVIALNIDRCKITLLNNIITFYKQLEPLEKKKDDLRAALTKFDRLLSAHDHKLQRKRERNIYKAIENLVSAIHASQEKNGAEKNDLGIIKCYEEIQSAGAAIAEMIEKILAQQAALEEKLQSFIPQATLDQLLANEDQEVLETDLSDEDDATSYTSEEEEEEEEEKQSTPPSSPAESKVINASSLFKTPRAKNDTDEEENRFDKKRRLE